MSFIKTPFFRKYFLPGFVFQSVVIGGGYGTGRELVEYFLRYGPVKGLLGLVCVTAIMWSVSLAVFFECVRVLKAYDYRSFFSKILGKFWIIFEILYIIAMLIVLAVVGSAAGVLLRDNFGIPYFGGVTLMFIAIGFHTFKGSEHIEKFLAAWSFVLYAIYGIIFITAMIKFGPVIIKNFRNSEIHHGWLQGGFKYAVYNFQNIPAVMFCLTYIETRKEACGAGLIAGLIGIFPGLLFFIAVVSQYPAVLQSEIPVVFLLDKIGIATLLIVFQIVLFGTLVETGTGFIHAVNERIQSVYQADGKNFPRSLRPVIAIAMLTLSTAISSFGIISLIAKGYGALSWGFFAVFVIPLFTVGLYKIMNAEK
ncbi:MAG: hypothetical protein JXB48_20305 [Candidatus Latescibacteria bacterium]|nr:hypothetical protein [Candidatus Latescibacterota bacterium]